MIVIVGAGPAGLTAGYLLSKEKVAVTVLESNPNDVGGIARTVVYKGYHFDVGGHRFFSKSEYVNALWQELLPNGLLTRPRKSRIYYQRQFFDYPLKPFNALKNLGLWESIRCFWSYLKVRCRPIDHPKTFEEWVVNQFGSRLFNIFFKTYTEKVWGMPCSQISADWAAERIRGLSLWSALINAIFPTRGQIKSLVHQFLYPRNGPGMMWQAARDKIEEQGGTVQLGANVQKLCYVPEKQQWEVTYQQDQDVCVIWADQVISTMAIRDLMQCLGSSVPAEALAHANALQYRDFLQVGLMVTDRKSFDDQWLYIHDPQFKVGRIQNFKSWSPDMVPNDDTTCYGMEYFCFENDALWKSSDEALIQLASCELVALGLAEADDILEGYVIRQVKAYPVYDEHYLAHVEGIRAFLKTAAPKLQLVGRNGMHQYNNQDHAMMTAALAAQNILLDREEYDVWKVGQDGEYIEEFHCELRKVPQKITVIPASQSQKQSTRLKAV